MILKPDHIVVGAFQENTYFLKDESGNVIVVDPGGSGIEIDKYLKYYNLNLSLIVNTHGHIDHVEANNYLKEKYGVNIYIHSADAETFDIAHDGILEDGDIIKFLKHTIKVIHTPGHTMGSVCLVTEGYMLTGDTLFAGTIGRTDLGGDMGIMMETLKRCFNDIPDDMVLYPGHGRSTTMGEERRVNPYLKCQIMNSEAEKTNYEGFASKYTKTMR